MANGALDNIGAVTTTTPNTISQSAQDVAKAQGVAYSDISKTEAERGATDFQDYDANKVGSALSNNISFKDSGSYIDTAKQTVAGQLQSLLASDSPYLKQQEQKAVEKAGSRGLINSGLAVEFGRRAAIEGALPIAQQDAQMYNQFAKSKQDAEYNAQNVQVEAIVSGGLAEQNAAIKQKQQDIQNAFTSKMQGASDQSKTWLQDLQQQHTTFESDLDRQHQAILQNQSISAEKAASIRTQASSIMQNYQISVENLMTDPDFLNLGETALQNTISQLQTLASNSINFIGASSGVDLSDFVDTYLEPITITK